MLIQLSGLDNAGKSTQIVSLVNKFKSLDLSVKVQWARFGYTPGIERVKSILHVRRGHSNPSLNLNRKVKNNEKTQKKSKLWLLLSLIDYFFYTVIYLRFLESRYDVVILDRGALDAVVDYILASGTSPKFGGKLLSTFEFIGPALTLVIFLSVSEDVAARRSIEKKEPFPDNPIVKKARKSIYLSLRSTHSVVEISGDDDIENVFASIWVACKGEM